MLKMFAIRSLWRNPVIWPSIVNVSSVAAASDAASLKEARNTGLVAAAFENLKEDEPILVEDLSKNCKDVTNENMKNNKVKREVSQKILAAQDVSTLLSLTDKGLSRQDSLKIISKLSEWSSTNKIKFSDFESDERFKKLCQFLGRQAYINDNKKSYKPQSDDLTTVLSVTGDDEAAKLINSLNIPQMVKIMLLLAQKKRRSTPLLRALSFNISRHTDVIDLKKCADLLYAMALLNFPDPVLMDRICSDIQEKLSENTDKSSIIGSIASSLGFLKYKDEKLLDRLVDWVSTYQTICRPQDVASVIVTMGILGHNPIDDQQPPKLVQADFTKKHLYLDYVWSLLVLNNISEEQIASVLKPEFIDSLKINGDLPISSQKKLCNISGYAKLAISGYKGSYLPDDMMEALQIPYSKEKIQFVDLMLETIKSLVSSDSNLKRNCDSKMGFTYDAMMILDAKCNPYSIDTDTAKTDKRLIKVAMFALEYHDTCRNTGNPLGYITLYKRLLELQGYKVVLIPHTDFSSRDKLVHRVQYINTLLKDVVKE